MSIPRLPRLPLPEPASSSGPDHFSEDPSSSDSVGPCQKRKWVEHADSEPQPSARRGSTDECPPTSPRRTCSPPGRRYNLTEPNLLSIAVDIWSQARSPEAPRHDPLSPKAGPPLPDARSQMWHYPMHPMMMMMHPMQNNTDSVPSGHRADLERSADEEAPSSDEEHASAKSEHAHHPMLPHPAAVYATQYEMLQWQQKCWLDQQAQLSQQAADQNARGGHPAYPQGGSYPPCPPNMMMVPRHMLDPAASRYMNHMFSCMNPMLDRGELESAHPQGYKASSQRMMQSKRGSSKQSPNKPSSFILVDETAKSRRYEFQCPDKECPNHAVTVVTPWLMSTSNKFRCTSMHCKAKKQKNNYTIPAHVMKFHLVDIAGREQEAANI